MPRARGRDGSRLLTTGPQQQDPVICLQRSKPLSQYQIVRLQFFKLLHQRLLASGYMVQAGFQLFFRLRQLVVLQLRHKILRQRLARLADDRIRLDVVQALLFQ